MASCCAVLCRAVPYYAPLRQQACGGQQRAWTLRLALQASTPQRWGRICLCSMMPLHAAAGALCLPVPLCRAYSCAGACTPCSPPLFFALALALTAHYLCPALSLPLLFSSFSPRDDWTSRHACCCCSIPPAFSPASQLLPFVPTHPTLLAHMHRIASYRSLLRLPARPCLFSFGCLFVCFSSPPLLFSLHPSLHLPLPHRTVHVHSHRWAAACQALQPPLHPPDPHSFRAASGAHLSMRARHPSFPRPFTAFSFANGAPLGRRPSFDLPACPPVLRNCFFPCSALHWGTSHDVFARSRPFSCQHPLRSRRGWWRGGARSGSGDATALRWTRVSVSRSSHVLVRRQVPVAHIVPLDGRVAAACCWRSVFGIFTSGPHLQAAHYRSRGLKLCKTPH